MIREGCEFAAFEDIDLEGEGTTLSGGIHRDWSSGLRSYDCKCNSSQNFSTSIHSTLDSTLPVMIEMPDGADDISALIKGSYGKHIGLLAALRSLKNKRSSRNAYIMLFGLTGAGKSATINFLFDNVTITKVGSMESTTSSIHEYRIPVTVDELGIKNSELRVIDTPGLGDTRGLAYDSQFLASLDTYLESHEDLGTRLPNIVLVFAKFDDNRFRGEGSSFVKMLRGLDHFRDRLFDRKYSNVIFVFTHFTSAGKKLKKNPKERLDAFKDVIRTFSLFPRPTITVVAENKPDDEELPMLNGFYKLPNNEFYPRNLFERIQETCTNGGDPIGEAVIRTAFKNPEKFNISEHTHELIPMESFKATQFMAFLSEKNFKIDETEVSAKLAHGYANMNNDTKRRYPDTLPYVQRALNIRNIISVKDVPRTSSGIVSLLKTLRQTPAVVELLEKGLGLKIPTLQINLITGYGYDILRDTALFSTPFETKSLSASDIVYLLPDIISCKIENKVVNVYKTFDSKVEYHHARLADLSVADVVVGGTRFPSSIVVRPGYNYNVIGDTNSTTTFTLTAVRETRLFQLTLNEGLKLNEVFNLTVKNLTPFNSTDYENVEAWKTFFEKYGTHVVSSAFGGGSIEIKVEGHLKTNETMELENAVFHVVQFAQKIFDGEVLDFNFTAAESGVKHSVRFNGGDFSYHTNDLTQHGVAGSTTLLNSWEDSLFLQPIILQSSLKLIPISQIVQEHDPEKAIQISAAAKSLYNASLVFTPPEVKSVTPPPRNETAIAVMEKMSADLQAKINEMSEEFKRRENELSKFREEIARQRAEEAKNRAKNAEELRILEKERLVGETIAALRDSRVNLAKQSFRTLQDDTKLEKIVREGYGGILRWVSPVLSFVRSLNTDQKKIGYRALVSSMKNSGHYCTKEMISVTYFAKSENTDGILEKLPSAIRLLIWDKIVSVKNRKTWKMLDSNELGQVYGHATNRGNYQNWTLGVYDEGNYIKFTNRQTGRVLDSTSAGRIYTLPDNGGYKQRWEPVPLNDGGECYFTFKNRDSGRVMDGNEAGKMYTHPSNGGQYQQWKLI